MTEFFNGIEFENKALTENRRKAILRSIEPQTVKNYMMSDRPIRQQVNSLIRIYTSEGFSDSLASLVNENDLHFFDHMAAYLSPESQVESPSKISCENLADLISRIETAERATSFTEDQTKFIKKLRRLCTTIIAKAEREIRERK